MTSEIELLLQKLKGIPDYPALREVQNALWGAGEVRGAAVMVGAGFSLNAERSSAVTPNPPLWRDFARRMVTDLYPSSPGSASADPLRLAEEYRAAFGPPALDAMIREMVPDRLWKPGSLHRELLALPWSDVLTTNWDTLLERAADEEHERAYELVETVDAIARTRSPRIVKLHGSLPSHTPFVFTSEDYRNYPKRFAPFVNLAQQALLENDMVLLGFSGDDPNFLQWTGWVRDQLGASARRIRLVGVLRLSAAQRRLLESQNVTPVDLEPLVALIDPVDQHRVATEVLFASLRAAKPIPVRNWGGRSERLQDDSEPELIADVWAAERISYPGWVLAPPQARFSLRFNMERHLFRLQEAFPRLKSPLRGTLLREIIWRCDVSLWTLPQWVVDALPDVLVDPQGGFDRVSRFDAQLALATAARRERDQQRFDSVLGAAAENAKSPDERAAVAYERCLEARDRLDYATVADLLRGIDGLDPAWALRKASLQAFLCERRGSVHTAHEALKDIRRRRARDRGSVWLLSREAWALLIVRQGWYDLPELDGERDEWPSRYSEIDCDPWNEFTNFDHLLREEQRKHKGEEVAERSFEPGIRIRNEGDGGWTTSARLRAFDELWRVLDRAGFARLPGIDVVEDRLQSAALNLGEDRCDSWSVLLSVRDWSKGLINDRFNRIAIARLDQDIVDGQIAGLRNAIEYGRSRLSRLAHPNNEERQSSWIEQVRRMVELLSRLAIRLDSEKATELFGWARGLTDDRNFDHWWLYRPLENLLNRCFDAVAPADRSALALPIMEVPLPGERDLPGMDREWPELATKLADAIPTVSREGPGWTTRIAKALALLRSEKPLARSRAMLRIYALNKRELLTPDEAASAADGVWSAKSNGGERLPNCPELMPHIIFELPEPTPGISEEAFRADIVVRILDNRGSYEDYETLGSAARATRPFKLTAAEASAIATLIVGWSPPERRPSSGRRRVPEWYDRQEAESRAHALVNAVIPQLPETDLNDALVDALLNHAVDFPAFVWTLPTLVARIPMLQHRAYREIRRSIVSSEVLRAYAGWRAVYSWIELSRDSDLSLPDGLASDVIAAVEARHEPALLPALQRAEELITRDVVPAERLEHLPGILDLLFVETSYTNQDRGGLRADTLTLIRAACVRLASAVAKKGITDEGVTDWTLVASTDPIPEVRYALSTVPD